MYLSRLYIENYRSIKKLDLKYGKGKNIIVGKNNSGKSNIIRAINLILGEKSPTWEKSENITDNDLLEFSTEEGQERIDHDFRKEWIGVKSYCIKGFNSELRDMTNFAFAFRCQKESEVYIKQLLFLYKKANDTDWFFGINANLRNELLQSAIIPSFRDPKDQLRITNYTWYGKLLKECVKKDKETLAKNLIFNDVKIKIKSNGTEKEIGLTWLNDYNISIINCGGKMEFWKYVKIFSELNIPWLVLADFDFLREGLNDFFTKLSYNQEFINKLNSLKSKITISGKYKSISDIGNPQLEREIKDYISNLSKEEEIHILTGELESFYKKIPKFTKEAGVIETISRRMEENKTIDESRK